LITLVRPYKIIFVTCNQRYITNLKAVQNPLQVLHLKIKQQHESLQTHIAYILFHGSSGELFLNDSNQFFCNELTFEFTSAAFCHTVHLQVHTLLRL